MNIGKYLELYTEELQFKNYAKNTIHNYVFQVGLFLKHFDGKFTKPSEINETEIKDWLMQAKTVNSRKHKISAVKLFYIYTIKQPLKFKHITYPRCEQHLPQPLSEAEVKSLFESCNNSKHKCILSLLFMCGMRVSEVINLMPHHIDRQNMVIHIKQSKGMKDRIVPINKQIIKMLENYYREYRPIEYMFNGQFSNKYSQRSINQFIKQIGKKANIKKALHSHLGRHSCFSQMLANGVDMAVIQKIAGHSNIRTTQMYAKITPSVIQNTTPYKDLL